MSDDEPTNLERPDPGAGTASHWVVADASTAPALAKVLLATLLRQSALRLLLLLVMFWVVAEVVFGLVVGRWELGLALGPVVAVLVLLRLFVLFRRSSRRLATQIAPPGQRLGVGFGPDALTVRTGTGTGRQPYSTIRQARVRDGFMVLHLPGRAVLVLPAELFPDSFPTAVATGAAASLDGWGLATDGPAPDGPPEVPITQWFVVDAGTAPALARALLSAAPLRLPRVVSRLGDVLVLVAAALVVLAGAAVGSVSIVVMGVLVAAVPLVGVRARQRQAQAVARLVPPGERLGVGFGPEALAVQVGTGTALLPYSQIKKAQVYDGFMVVTAHDRQPIALPAHMFPPGFETDAARRRS